MIKGIFLILKIALATLFLLLATAFTESKEPLPKQIPVSLPLQVAPDLTIVSAQFGWFAPTAGPRDLQFIPGDQIPYVPGLHYGWTLEVETPLKKMLVKETLTLPEAPESWGLPGKYGLTEISEDGKTGTTKTEVAIADDGIAAKPPWRIVKGDPLGPHHLRLFVGDHLILDQAFTIVPAEQFTASPAETAKPESVPGSTE